MQCFRRLEEQPRCLQSAGKLAVKHSSPLASSAANENMKAINSGIKSVMGASGKKTAPLKDDVPITDGTKQLHRWIDCFSELFGKRALFYWILSTWARLYKACFA